jgi:macrolide transport system ATP-binding/permease protein
MLHDLRYSLRTLRQNPGFALVAIISLALGIGANAAIFSFADALILRPLAVPHASGLIQVQSQSRGETLADVTQYMEMSYPDYRDLRDRAGSFSGLAATNFAQFGFATQKDALPKMKFGAMVSGNFFDVLEVHPALGRGFQASEDQAPGRDAVVVLSDELWKSEFAARPDVLGQTVFLDGIAFTVVGVTPTEFTGPDTVVRTALYVPMAMASRLAADTSQNVLENRGLRMTLVDGRLQPGITLAHAAAEARVISQQLARAYPQTNRTTSFVVGTELQARLRQGRFDAVLAGFLLVLAVVVLLIACANVMNLLLSRARARSREIAVRLAIGAGRMRLIRQLLTESVVIAVLGGFSGLFVAQAGIDLLSRLPVPSDIPVSIDARLDERVLLFAMVLALVSAVVFGLAPAIQSARPDLVPSLKSGQTDAGKRRHFAGRNALVIAQVAGSLVLLVFATQAFRGARVLLSSPWGFRTDHLLMASFDPSLARYSSTQSQDFYRRLLDKTRVLPGVKSAALAQAMPMAVTGVGMSRIVPEGVMLPAGAEALHVLSNVVSDGYFAAVGIPLIEGREFRITDRTDSPRVAIVNEAFARRQYPKGSAIGKRFRLNSPAGPLVEIVGVARQAKYVFPVEPTFQFLYLPLSQNPESIMTLMVQTGGPSGVLAGPLRDLVHSMDPGQPIVGLRTIEEYFDQRGRQTLNILIEAMGGMGLLGLVLALVGLYGLMSYSVGRRQREIGIRMAIGADAGGVLKMVLKQGLLLAGGGIAVGLILSLAAGKPATNLIGSSYFYLPLLALVVAGLLAAAALGAFIPARRASLVDPIAVLRQE